jgi:hypothetical protein
MCIDPDFDLCDNYFQVKDGEALRAIYKGQHVITGNKVRLNPTDASSQRFKTGRSKKTALKMLLRNAVWNCGRWRGRLFKNWVEVFKPEVLVLQSGDSAFMLNLARKLADERKIPLIIYNTEGYLFFDHNYLSPHYSDGLCFPLFRYQYRRAFKKALTISSWSIYLNGKLQEDYEKYMPHNSSIIYNSSDMDFRKKEHLSSKLKISYLGNLGLRRPEALVEVGSVLQSISKDYHIDVYGNATKDNVELLESASGVVYHGAVPYDEVKQIIHNSDIVFHVEKNDPVLCRELRYAFSTKIADSICSGTPFVIYAPANLACSQYALSTGGAWHADSPESLRCVIERIISGDNSKVIAQAETAARANHGLGHNSEIFRSIIANVCRP